MEITKIEVHSVKEIEYEDKETQKKKKFTVYKAVTKAGKLIDLKFTSSCAIKPTKPCYILVYENNWNVQRNLKFPVLWVQEVEDIEDFPTSNDSDLF